MSVPEAKSAEKSTGTVAAPEAEVESSATGALPEASLEAACEGGACSELLNDKEPEKEDTLEPLRSGKHLLGAHLRGTPDRILQEQIREVQRRLGIVESGNWSEETEKAVRAFQAQAEIAVDGLVGPETTAALDRLPGEASAALVEEKTPPEEIFELTIGARGELVESLQEMLNTAGANLNVDGIFGRQTRAIVREFQEYLEDKGLHIEVNGKVDGELMGFLEASAKYSRSREERLPLRDPKDDPITAASPALAAYYPNLSDEFLRRVQTISEKMGIDDPRSLMAVMSFETGGTFDPAEKQQGGGSGIGLFQFLSSTAQKLGTSRFELAGMTALEQLEYCERYLAPYQGHLNDLESVYLAVLKPSALFERESDIVFAAGTEEYHKNPFDVDGDGTARVPEIMARVLPHFRSRKIAKL